MSTAYYDAMSDKERMDCIVKCWALAEKRAKHLCAFETLGLNFRCRRPSQQEVRKAWHKLCVRIHPDKHSCSSELFDLATEATGCLNLAKEWLFDELFGNADERVKRKYEKRGPVVVAEDGTTPASDEPSAEQGSDDTNKRSKSEVAAPHASPAADTMEPSSAAGIVEPAVAEAAGSATAAAEDATSPGDADALDPEVSLKS